MRTRACSALGWLLSMAMSWSLGCAPGTPPEPSVEGHERELGLHNGLLRAEIAHALNNDPRPLRARTFAMTDHVRVLGAVGPSVEREEVVDLERLFQRLYFEDFSFTNLGLLFNLGSPAAVRLTGKPDPRVRGKFAEQPALAPPEGEAMSLGVVAEVLDEAGLTTLRPDVVLFAAHQRAVAVANNAALRDVPLGTVFTGVKGMSFAPTFLDPFGKPKSVTKADDSVNVLYQIDIAYRSPAPPTGARFELGDIGEIDEVTAAELGRYLPDLAGVQQLLDFEQVVARSDVPSPPLSLWSQVGSPGSCLGHRLRILSAMLDRLELDGVLTAEHYLADGEHEPLVTRATLTRASFLASLPSLLYHAWEVETPLSTAGVVFVEGDVSCKHGPPCPLRLQQLLTPRQQKPAAWHVPTLRLLDRGGDQYFLPFGRIDGLHVEGFDLGVQGATTYAESYQQLAPPAPSDVDPLAAPLDPWPPWRPDQADLITTRDGHAYELFEHRLFRDGELITPRGFELGGTTAFAHKTPLVVEGRIFFLYRSAPPAWRASRGTLVFDTRDDSWWSAPVVHLQGWQALTLEGAVLSGVDGETLETLSIDLGGLSLTRLTGVEPPPGAAPPCFHLACAEGEALAHGCDPCAAAVCEMDSFCCESSWDELCTWEAGVHCDPCQPP